MKTSSYLLAAAVLLTSAFATHADELSDLKTRFASRDPQIQQLKIAGKVGETYTGYLDTPGSASGEEKKLIEAENDDRRKLYALLAKKEGATPEVVADRAARRNFARAASGEYLKAPDGQWRKKP